MSARLTTLSAELHLNSTKDDGESRGVINACKVFNIFMLSLSVCVLAVTAVLCCVSHLNSWRDRKQAYKYESSVTCDLEEKEPVKLKLLKRSQSSRKSQPQESFGKDDDIYYIYTNPLPVGCCDDDDHMLTHTTLTLNASDDGSQNPPTFYLQL